MVSKGKVVYLDKKTEKIIKQRETTIKQKFTEEVNSWKSQVNSILEEINNLKKATNGDKSKELMALTIIEMRLLPQLRDIALKAAVDVARSNSIANKKEKAKLIEWFLEKGKVNFEELKYEVMKKT